MSVAVAHSRPRAARIDADARLLQAAATFFTVAVLLHNGDHLRRGGDSVGSDVFWLGTAAILVELGVVVLAFMPHPSAPIAALAAGFPLALGYLFVHFTPERSWLSDSFLRDGVSPLSWSAASLETVAAIVLGLAGLVVLRRRGLASATGTADASVASAFRHPVVLAMAVGNIVILIGAVLTR